MITKLTLEDINSVQASTIAWMIKHELAIASEIYAVLFDTDFRYKIAVIQEMLNEELENSLV